MAGLLGWWCWDGGRTGILLLCDGQAPCVQHARLYAWGGGKSSGSQQQKPAGAVREPARALDRRSRLLELRLQQLRGELPLGRGRLPGADARVAPRRGRLSRRPAALFFSGAPCVSPLLGYATRVGPGRQAVQLYRSGPAHMYLQLTRWWVPRPRHNALRDAEVLEEWILIGR